MDSNNTTPSQKKKRRIILIILCLLLLLVALITCVFKYGAKPSQLVVAAIPASKSTDTAPVAPVNAKAVNTDNSADSDKTTTATSSVSIIPLPQTKKGDAIVKDTRDLTTQNSDSKSGNIDSEYLALDSTFANELIKILKSGTNNFEKYKGPAIKTEMGDTVYGTNLKSEYEIQIVHTKNGPVFRVVFYNGPGRDYAYKLQYWIFGTVILWTTPTLHSKNHMYTFRYHDMDVSIGVHTDDDDNNNYISEMEIRHH